MNLAGVFPPIPTPFLDEAVDHRALAGNVSRWMQTRLAGLVVLGSNGEAPQLDGLVAGLTGSAQYEQHAGLPGQASRHWSALGGGLWAAVRLIAGGNAVYATAAALRRRRR